MRDHKRTMELVGLAQKGDEEAKTTLLVENSPLIKSIIKRFRGKGVDYDDLYQLASLGFMKAINNFDEKFEVKFSTYVVPMCIGEVKRFMRDDGILKVSRKIKSQGLLISRFIETFKLENGREPRIKDIADGLEMTEHDVVFAMDSNRQPISIFEKVDDKSERSNMLIDKIPSKDTMRNIEDIIVLKDEIAKLDERERKIIILRYFRDKTQGEIAEYFGLSQVQISRIEGRVIDKLRQKFTP